MPATWGQEKKMYPPEHEGSLLSQYARWLDLNGLSLRIERRGGKWFCVMAEDTDDHLKIYTSSTCDSLNDALDQCYLSVRRDEWVEF